MSFFDAGLVIDQSAAATIDGAWLNIPDKSVLCIQTEWTGTLTGTFSLEGRANEALSGQAITEVALTAPAGVAGGQLYHIGNAAAKQYRVRFTKAGGSGTLKVAMFAKESL